MHAGSRSRAGFGCRITRACGSGRRRISRASGPRSGSATASSPRPRTSVCSPRGRCRGRNGSPARASTSPSTSSAARRRRPVAIRHASEMRSLAEVTHGELRDEVTRLAGGFRALGVGPGDRVAAYLPNIPEAIAAFLACASIGAIWSSCSPDFGARSVIDRFAQIEPRVLLCVDGYRYGGKDFDRRGVLSHVLAERADRRAHRRPGLSRPATRPGWAPGRALLGGPPGSGWRRAAPLRTAALRPSTLGALQLRHDGPAEGDRARPRRCPARDAEEDAPASRPARRRPVVLVHDHGLDDVELRRQWPHLRRVGRPVRRQPGNT